MPQGTSEEGALTTILPCQTLGVRPEPKHVNPTLRLGHSSGSTHEAPGANRPQVSRTCERPMLWYAGKKAPTLGWPHSLSLAMRTRFPMPPREHASTTGGWTTDRPTVTHSGKEVAVPQHGKARLRRNFSIATDRLSCAGPRNKYRSAAHGCAVEPHEAPRLALILEDGRRSSRCGATRCRNASTWPK